MQNTRDMSYQDRRGSLPSETDINQSKEKRSTYESPSTHLENDPSFEADPDFDPDQTISSTNFDHFINLASARTEARLRLETKNAPKSSSSNQADSAIAFPEQNSSSQSSYEQGSSSFRYDALDSNLANRISQQSRPFQPLPTRSSSILYRAPVDKQTFGDSQLPFSSSTLLPSAGRVSSLVPTHASAADSSSPNTPGLYSSNYYRLRSPVVSSVTSPTSPSPQNSNFPPRSYQSPSNLTNFDDRPARKDLDHLVNNNALNHPRPSSEYYPDYSLRQEIRNIKDRIGNLGLKTHQSSRSVAIMPTGPIREFQSHQRQRSTSVAPSATPAGLASPRRQYRPPYAARTTTPEHYGNLQQQQHLLSLQSNQTARYPLLHDALTRAKSSLQPSLYRALETLASDALDLAMLTSGGSSAEMSGATSIFTTAGSTPERQVRRKAESLCRSVTEMAIAMCDISSSPLHGQSQYENQNARSRAPEATDVSVVVPRETNYEPQQISTDHSSNNLTPLSPRITTSRALDRIEARRTSLYHSQANTPTQPTGKLTFANRATSILNPSPPESEVRNEPVNNITSPQLDANPGNGSTNMLRRQRPILNSSNIASTTATSRTFSETTAPPSRASTIIGNRNRYSSVESRQQADLNPNGLNRSSTITASHPPRSFAPSAYESVKSPPSAIASLKLRNRISSSFSSRPSSSSGTLAKDSNSFTPTGSRTSYISSANATPTDPSRGFRFSGNYSSTNRDGSNALDGKAGHAARQATSVFNNSRPHSTSISNRTTALSSSSASSSPPASSAVASAATVDTSRSIMFTPPRTTKFEPRISFGGSNNNGSTPSFGGSHNNDLPERTSSRITSLPPSSIYRTKYGLGRNFQSSSHGRGSSSIFGTADRSN